MKIAADLCFTECYINGIGREYCIIPILFIYLPYRSVKTLNCLLSQNLLFEFTNMTYFSLIYVSNCRIARAKLTRLLLQLLCRPQFMGSVHLRKDFNRALEMAGADIWACLCHTQLRPHQTLLVKHLEFLGSLQTLIP